MVVLLFLLSSSVTHGGSTSMLTLLTVHQNTTVYQEPEVSILEEKLRNRNVNIFQAGMLWISWKADNNKLHKIVSLSASKYLCRFQRIHDENCGICDDNEIVVLYTVEVCIRSTLNPCCVC